MALFNVPSKPPFKGLYIYAFLAFLGFVIADLGIMFLRPHLLPQGTPPAPKKTTSLKNPPVMAYKNITTRNIFNEDGLIPDPVLGGKNLQEGPVQDNVPVRTSLAFLKLLGTIVHFNPQLSIATIHLNNSNKAQAFRVGEQIETAALITEISRRKVVFRNLQNQRLEFIDIPESSRLTLGFSSPTTRTSNPEVNINTSPPPQQGDVVRKENNQFEMTRDSLAKYTDNLPNVLQQARVLPNTGPDGNIDGFRFTSIQPNSIFEQLGFQVGDKIISVNGEPVSSPAQAMQMYNALKSSNSVAVGVERNGRQEEFNYNIK